MTEPQTYKVKRSEDGQFYWTVQAENGEVLATSETYTTKQKAIEGAHAAGATIVDEVQE